MQTTLTEISWVSERLARCDREVYSKTICKSDVFLIDTRQIALSLTQEMQLFILFEGHIDSHRTGSCI